MLTIRPMINGTICKFGILFNAETFKYQDNFFVKGSYLVEDKVYNAFCYNTNEICFFKEDDLVEIVQLDLIEKKHSIKIKEEYCNAMSGK